MFIKPTKTYNNKPKAKLYKRYTQMLDTYGLPTEVKYIAVMISGICYGVYDSYNDLTQVSWNYGLQLINEGKCLIVTYVGATIYNPADDYFYRLESVTAGEDVEDNTATFSESASFNNLSLYNAKSMGQLAFDKFYYIQDFDYTEENDTDIDNTQILKGATIKTETMNIRWDVENLPIEKDDYLVIDNKVWQVGPISISKRFQPMLIKTYRTELMRIV